MKKLILILSLILTTFVTKASHMMGGIIQVAQTSQDSTSIGMYVVSDIFPTLPNQVSIEKWVMNSQGWYDLDGYITLDKFNTNTHQGFNTANYGSNYLDLDSGKYRFIYRNCCWPVLVNSTNSTQSEFVLSTDYWHVPNNSTPYMINPLWVNVEKNAVNSMKPVWGQFNCYFGLDNNDSVNLTMSDIYSSYSNGVFVPQVQTSTNVLSSNDSITFVGTNLGSHGYGFQIDKYRSGYLLTTQRLQWTFIVRNSTLGIDELTTENMNYKVYDWQGRYMGTSIKTLNSGLYIVKYNNGKPKKIYKL
jgi:hypothetical protein